MAARAGLLGFLVPSIIYRYSTYGIHRDYPSPCPRRGTDRSHRRRRKCIMKHSVDGISGEGMSARFLRAVAAGIAALMLAALVQPAAAQFQAPDIAVNEGEVAVFGITLPKTYNFAVRFYYRTEDITARKGRHYIAKQGHLVFPAGTRRASVGVQTRVSPIGPPGISSWRSPTSRCFGAVVGVLRGPPSTSATFLSPRRYARRSAIRSGELGDRCKGTAAGGSCLRRADAFVG